MRRADGGRYRQPRVGGVGGSAAVPAHLLPCSIHATHQSVVRSHSSAIVMILYEDFVRYRVLNACVRVACVCMWVCACGRVCGCGVRVYVGVCVWARVWVWRACVCGCVRVGACGCGVRVYVGVCVWARVGACMGVACVCMWVCACTCVVAI